MKRMLFRNNLIDCFLADKNKMISEMKIDIVGGMSTFKR